MNADVASVKPVVGGGGLNESCKGIGDLAVAHANQPNSARASRRTIGGFKVDSDKIKGHSLSLPVTPDLKGRLGSRGSNYRNRGTAKCWQVDPI